MQFGGTCTKNRKGLAMSDETPHVLAPELTPATLAKSSLRSIASGVAAIIVSTATMTVTILNYLGGIKEQIAAVRMELKTASETFWTLDDASDHDRELKQSNPSLNVPSALLIHHDNQKKK